MFSKEILLSKITNLNDFKTIQYIAQNNFAISLIIMWIITFLIIILFGFGKMNKSTYWIAFGTAIGINLLLTILIISGILPAVTSINR